MSLRSRSSKEVSRRTASSSRRDRDPRDGPFAQLRFCALQPRPPACGAHSSSNSKGAKSTRKCSVPSAPSISKRTAAMRMSLRAHLPHLRPILRFSVSMSGEPIFPSLRLKRRSLSSNSAQRDVAMANKPSYSIIPEALLQVKHLCNSAEPDRDASLSIGACYGSLARERRTGRPTPSASMGLSEDATTVVQLLEAVQSTLFSSLQRGSAIDAMSLFTPRRDNTAGNSSHGTRSRSWSSPNNTNLTPAGTGALSTKERKKAWALFLHKNTQAFALIVNSCRSSLAVREPQVGSVLLTFLYNVLRHMSGDKQRRAVLLCEKLGIIRACTLALQEGKSRLRQSDKAGGALVASLRACEAAALIFTLWSTFNVKLWTTFRLTQSLDSTFVCASVTFHMLEAEFAAYCASFQSESPNAPIPGAQENYPSAHTCKETLAVLRRFQSRTQWTCGAFSHFCFTLFAFTGNSPSAVDLGVRGAELCGTAIAMCTFFLSQIAPMLLSRVKSNTSGKKDFPHLRSLVAINENYWVPSWVMRLMRRVELMLLWCVALMQRLTSCDKIRLAVSDVALRFHVPRSIAFYLSPPSQHILQVAPRRECVHVILLLLSALLRANRSAALDDMKDLGGLKGVVSSVLAFSEKSSHHWHHFYLQLCSMYGYTMLPSWNGHSACYVDERVPASLQRLRDTSKMSGGKSKSAEIIGGSVGAADTRAAAAVRLSSTQPSLSQCMCSASEDVSDPPSSPPCAAADLGRKDVHDNLLLVDVRPDVFSPELRSGDVDPVSALTAFDSSQLPWLFTDAAPPTTANIWNGTAPLVSAAAEDAHLSVPLINVSEEDRIQVLRHHIARLTLLNETACDGGPTPHLHKVVFERLSSASPAAHGNAPGVFQQSADGVHFFSNYEGGNLQRAIEVSDSEYDLVLSWDTATNSYTQWFSFGMRRFTPGKTYRFNILNMEKLDSTFNEGQKPLLLHVPDCPTPPDSSAPPLQWVRAGEGIYYFENAFLRPPRAHYFGKNGDTTNASVTSPLSVSSLSRLPPPSVGTLASQLGSRAPPPVTAKKRVVAPLSSPPTSTPPLPVSPTSAESAVAKQKRYFTVTFSITMPATMAGTVYLANCFPFTYTEMREHLSWLTKEGHACPTRSLLTQCLCKTPGGVQVPLVTVTSLRRRDTGEAYTTEEIRRRPMALLVARVHPGETNASWVMQGLLDTLLCPLEDSAEYASHLCDNFVFKVIPMLNADGVIVGNHRCSLAGVDLNRDYTDPKAEPNPTLYAMKRLLRFWIGEEKRQVVVFADFHGHSRAKNFLLYGCTMDTIRGVATHPRRKGRGGNRSGPHRRVRSASITTPAGPEKMIAALLSQLFPSFSLSKSSFAVTKDKKGSARVVLYDEFGVRMSYGFEATMVGGLVCVPELLRASSDLKSEDVAEELSAVCMEEVHYSPTVYRAMGGVFLRALSLLFQQWVALTASAVNSDDIDRKSSPSDVPESAVLQLSWDMTAAAGSDRHPPKDPPSFSLKEDGAGAVRVGPFAAATRRERRGGPPVAAGAAAAPREVGIASSGVSLAGQAEALDYLFMADCREDASLMEGEAYEVEEDDSASATDAYFSDDSADDDLDDAESSVAVNAKGMSRRMAGRQETEGGEDASEISDRGASFSDSGSDDQEWSDFNSLVGSGAEEFDDNQSSGNSVEKEIPTNLFM
ncbi:hypothetical protein JKF63_02034 [Porcisia hertigi]|uniref:Peptidase M14 domain-containing protein n=1 Tax=Porcisia hertigi TaxID=2761500 RepID=A0A836H7B5_9TRYP|nr:hypothetical protein JKF63_02034 [Porcisia hertigi]